MPGRDAAWAADELFVTNLNNDSVTVYGRTASGDVAPLRTIKGAATKLGQPFGLAVDALNGEIVVANPGRPANGRGFITVYGMTDDGNVTPLRTIKPRSGFGFDPFGLAVDAVNDEIVVADRLSNSIFVFSRTASGDVDPLRVISGNALFADVPYALAVDTVHDEIVVGSITQTSSYKGSISFFSRTANGGTVSPLRTIKGGGTGLNVVTGIAVDPINDEVIAANHDGSSITVHSRTANGNVPALRTIHGDATGLASPEGLALDPVNQEVIVANDGNSLTVHQQTADGNVAPLRTLQGPATQLRGPVVPAVPSVPIVVRCPSAFHFAFGGTDYADCFRDLLRGSEINAGLDLGGTAHSSLSFTGNTGATASTWLAVYDATPTTPSAEPTFASETLCADLLIERFNNVKGTGLVTLFNEGVGRQGLALIVYDAGNSDNLVLATVDGDPSKKGKLVNLQSVSLQGRIVEKAWYRLIMTVDPTIPTVVGKVFQHTDPVDPASPLGSQVGTSLGYTPASLPAGVSASGENGIMATAINAVVNASVTNFTNDPTRCSQ